MANPAVDAGGAAWARIVSAPLAGRERDQHVGQRHVAEPRRPRLGPICTCTAAARTFDPAEPVAREVGPGVSAAAGHALLRDGGAAESSRARAMIPSA